MTPAQSKCLAFVHDYIQTYGCSPSYEEISTHLGLVSKSGVHRMVGALEDLGRLRRFRNRSRSLEVVGQPVLVNPGHAPTIDAAALAREIEQAHGFDDGEGVVIACTPAELLKTLQAVLR